MANNVPKHGDPIIEQQESSLGGVKFVASRQFQQFLDDLSSLSIDVDDDEEQDVVSISVQIGKNSATIRATLTQLDDITEYVTAIDAENSRLKAVIKNHLDSFDDLEQVVYAS